jgi:TetR/AcrR family transcriptional regulator, transcriptional repressor for nem operon
MTKAQTDTKKRIISIGEKLLLRQGYNGFSYADISSGLGVKNAAIHYYFPSKCDLGVAIIERGRSRFQKWREGVQASPMDEWETLDSFFQIYRSYLAKSNSVCLSGALETDFATLPQPMRDATRALVSDLLDWMTNFLRDGRERGAFSFWGTARDQAIVILSVIQGSIQMIRATDPSVFEVALAQIRRLLKPQIQRVEVLDSQSTVYASHETDIESKRPRKRIH